MDRVAALVLAGGRGGDFGALSEHRTKAAFPIGGMHRIIDFVLSNLSHSGVRHAGVIIQFLPASLMDHIGSGRAWDFDMADRRLRFMTPFVGVSETRWFRGTGDAIAKNLNFINMPGIDDVLILSGDHVYCMDYTELLRHHRESKADVTFAVHSVPYDKQHPRFGNVIAAPDGRVQSFIEKPHHPVSPLVSMGIFCIRREVLLDLVASASNHPAGADLSLAGDLLQPHIGRLQAQAWTYHGDWHYLADLRDYFDFHMALAEGRITLCEESWQVVTNFADRALGSRVPARFSVESQVKQCVVSPGCEIEGSVSQSVLSPGVRIAKGARVERCVIFHDVEIGPGCVVSNAVIDKDVVIGAGARVEGGSEILVLPKGCKIIAGEHVHPGMAIAAPIFF